ncbi:L-histidine N(alpha)-methyltransferase [Aquabacter sp. CN5-332]|uniref:L-histidine N(alpha)-methyltransferase n=1 Tax=Aquabacter sp. CN5-332 TaxID=3156608 RepID=UPI0032B440D7
MLLQSNIPSPGPSPEIDPTFRRDVLSGLRQRERTIPARWFYDFRGSELFEKITALPEYYLTRAEQEILTEAAPQISSTIGARRVVVEFGSGSSAKTRTLLAAIEPSSYVPVDISGEFLRASSNALRLDFPHLPIHEVEGDFTQPLALPSGIDGHARIGFFPGSTIGNLRVPDAVNLLRAIGSTLGGGAMLLIGIDRIKDRETLLAAYDDTQGVTAAFNLNLLQRINRELRGSIPVDAFNHLIRWNEDESRIEMHLEAKHTVRFHIDGVPFSMAGGETIHTENSLKYSLREARLLLRAGGWRPIADWTDRQEYFSLILAETNRPNLAP